MELAPALPPVWLYDRTEKQGSAAHPAPSATQRAQHQPHLQVPMCGFGATARYLPLRRVHTEILLHYSSPLFVAAIFPTLHFHYFSPSLNFDTVWTHFFPSWKNYKEWIMKYSIYVLLPFTLCMLQSVKRKVTVFSVKMVTEFYHTETNEKGPKFCPGLVYMGVPFPIRKGMYLNSCWTPMFIWHHKHL